MEVNLVVFKPNGKRAEAGLSPGVYIVGRDKTANFRIPIRSVSRTHCELTIDDQRIAVRDLGSTNGTLLNGKPTKQAMLKPGDVLTVGGVHMVVQIDGRPARIDRPDLDDLDLDLDLDDTPPGGISSPSPSKPPPMPSGDDSSMLQDSNITRSSTPAGKDDGDDSSIFDFDFDFEDKKG